ncbi:Radial spoke head 1 [Intoshia linei]|uniref:Radial spoke head 1 n=1 Tax=Intoshia linei TaxID=1819745 RepID=A0A177BCD2_9BILA|nr:Radial spoke head 1 [Intoshia linei]
MSNLGSEEIEEEQGPYLGEYEGERNQKDERHGRGKAILPNGDTYEGDYENGQRNGTGIYKFKNGARYTGEWLRNKKHGTGTFAFPDGSKYEGSWSEDQRNGIGKYYYVNGDIYDGEWLNHERSGQGSYTNAKTESTYIGVFHEGKMSGMGEVVYGTYKFIGSFKENKPEGKGKFVFANQCVQTGEYNWVEKPNIAGDEDETVIVPVWNAEDLNIVSQFHTDESIIKDIVISEDPIPEDLDDKIDLHNSVNEAVEEIAEPTAENEALLENFDNVDNVEKTAEELTEEPKTDEPELVEEKEE